MFRKKCVRQTCVVRIDKFSVDGFLIGIPLHSTLVSLLVVCVSSQIWLKKSFWRQLFYQRSIDQCRINAISLPDIRLNAPMCNAHLTLLSGEILSSLICMSSGQRSILLSNRIPPLTSISLRTTHYSWSAISQLQKMHRKMYIFYSAHRFRRYHCRNHL